LVFAAIGSIHPDDPSPFQPALAPVEFMSGSRRTRKSANFLTFKSSLIGCPDGIIPISRGRTPMIALRTKWMLNTQQKFGSLWFSETRIHK
jgi:hypothetical protein